MEQLTQLSEICISYRPTIYPVQELKSSKDVYTVLKQFFPSETIQLQEMFVVMYLNNNNKIIGVYRHSVGCINSTMVDVRLILGTALKSAATAIILAHNHPSGNLSPSEHDKRSTEKVKQGGLLMDIKVIDHIILTAEGYYSFADEWVL